MHILLTGAAGYIGRHLLVLLKKRSHKLTAVDQIKTVELQRADSVKIVNLSPSTNWEDILENVDAVIHLADGLRSFEGLRQVPGKKAEKYAVETTLNLARATQLAGVQTFVYLSSIKAAAGEYSDHVLVETDHPSPTRPFYGELKSQIETKLLDIADNSDMQVIALRSPVVYGPGIGANFGRLIKLADTPWPLPLAKINNRRSIISASNLCDGLSKAAENEPGKSGIYFIHDGKAISISVIVTILRCQLGRPVRLFKAPDAMISLAGILPSNRPIISRLTKSLELSDDKFRHDFGWIPPLATDAALKEMVETYKNID